MRDLIAKLEAAEEGSRELDGDIFRTAHPCAQRTDDHWWCFNGVWHHRDHEDSVAFDPPPHFTTSLDAAITLVPEQTYWNVFWDWDIAGPGAFVGERVEGNEVVWARSPALALCIAALKARTIAALKARTAEES